MKYLTKVGFMHKANSNKCKNWNKSHLSGRWTYHAATIDILKKATPKTILEAGSLGVKVAEESDALDYDGKKAMNVWPVFGKLEYNHDLKSVPWPIENKHYDFFVALRVFQHLEPVQKECFQEAKRIAKNIILALPNKIDPSVLKKWNNGTPPTSMHPTGFNTIVYYWKA